MTWVECDQWLPGVRGECVTANGQRACGRFFSWGGKIITLPNYDSALHKSTHVLNLIELYTKRKSIYYI